ncbi:MAG: hypothetical protein JWL75_141 [Parcubacteria group bacterium]|nr:hypothetical protein [Parcubacteria group bacterium]
MKKLRGKPELFHRACAPMIGYRPSRLLRYADAHQSDDFHGETELVAQRLSDPLAAHDVFGIHPKERLRFLRDLGALHVRQNDRGDGFMAAILALEDGKDLFADRLRVIAESDDKHIAWARYWHGTLPCEQPGWMLLNVLYHRICICKGFGGKSATHFVIPTDPSFYPC